MKDDYAGGLLEDIRDSVQKIAENVAGLNDKTTVIDKRLERVEQTTNRIPIIEAAVTSQTKQLNELGERVLAVESSA